MLTPKANTATPRCATIMPSMARGSWRARLHTLPPTPLPT